MSIWASGVSAGDGLPMGHQQCIQRNVCVPLTNVFIWVPLPGSSRSHDWELQP